jgi:hypothetical protein
VDGVGDAYVSGLTKSTTGNFPIVNGYQSSCPACADTTPGQDGFIAEWNPAGNSLLYSTYFGSVGGQQVASGVTNAASADSIALDSSGEIFFIGLTDATDLPTSSSAYQSSCPASVGGQKPCDSPYLAELNPTLSNQLVYSTLLQRHHQHVGGHRSQR